MVLLDDLKGEGNISVPSIDDVLSDIAKGRMVIVTDDADRENEGDLVMAAEKVTPERSISWRLTAVA